MRKGPMLLTGAATLLGLALRVNDLGRIGLGTDEGHSAWLAAQPLGDLARLLAADSAPPLYYVILSAWRSLFPSDVGLRALSVLLGTAAIPVLYLVGRRLAGEAAGVGAAFFMAVSNFHIEYSQMAKGYALFFLLTQGALLAMLAALRRPEGRAAWAALALCLAGMLYTHAVGPFMAAGVTVFGLIRMGAGWRRSWKPFLLAHAAAGLLFVPWLGVAIPQARAVVKAFWAPVPTLTTPLRTFEAFLIKPPRLPGKPRPRIPEDRPGITSLPFMDGAVGPRPHAVWVLIPAAAFLLCTVVAALSPGTRGVLALFALVAVPMAALLVISRTVGSIYLHRTLLPALTVVPVILSVPFALRAPGAAPERRGAPPWLIRAAGRLSAAAFVVMLLTGWHFAEVRVLPAWDLAAEHISREARPGEAIVYDGHFGQIITERYLTGTAAGLPAYGLPSDWFDGKTPTMGKWVTSDGDLDRLREAAAAHPALWFVRSHTAVHDPEDLGLAWCREHLEETEMQGYAGIQVHRFAVPAWEAP